MRFLLLCSALLISPPSSGFSQFYSGTSKIFENGQPTRTGADVGMFPDSPTRMKIDLSGAWQMAGEGNQQVSVTVPSSYAEAGRRTFSRTFEIKSEMIDKYVFTLVAYGINHQSEITINGTFLGRHAGGYSSFLLPIPQNLLQVGTENAIRIVVDNELSSRTTVPLYQPVGGMKTFGGIFRDIYLLATPRLWIEGAEASGAVATDSKSDSRTGRIRVDAEISDQGTSLTAGGQLGFQIEVFDKLSGAPAGHSPVVALSPMANKSIRTSAEVTLAGAKVWSTETPDLYTVRCQIVRVSGKEVSVLDEYSFDYGLRSIQWREGKCFINETATPLKGILWQEEHASYGSSLTYEVLERDIATMKTLGVNLIRFLYPPHPYMLNLCDRYGILALEEIPLYGVPADILEEDYYRDLATTYVKEMVLRDRSHASVLAWGIADECEFTRENAIAYLKEARAAVGLLDKRPVYCTARTSEDPCSEYSDFVSIVTRSGDPKTLREVLRQAKLSHPSKPIIVARYGREVEPGNRNGYSDPLSMESQARYAMLSFDAIRDAKIAGSVLWSFNDWRTDRPALGTHSQDPYLQSFGLVTGDREKRVAFEVVRAMYNGEKVQALPVGNYSSGAPIVFVLAGLVALISFAFLYNSNRRFRDCVNRSMVRTYNFFADVRDQRILTYGHSVFLAVIIALTWATLLSSFLSHYRESLLLDNLLSQFLSDSLKGTLIHLVWSPPKFILVMTILITVVMMLVTVLVRILSLMVRTHVYFYHAFSVTMWSMLPYIILIPVAMIAYRLMETEFYILPIAFLILLVTLWVFVRLFKGVSIIYDVYPIKVYTVGLLIIILTSLAVYGYLDYTHSTTVFLRYMVQSMKNPT